MLLSTLNSDKKDAMAALLTQGFQEIAVLAQHGNIKKAKSLASALAPIAAKAKDPDFDLNSTIKAFERHYRGYPPTEDETDWRQRWSELAAH
ncbi:MAG: hypothetical protein KGJ37_06625 [Verrucomicrobiota bacterium]|nr:hypothetical protein [Verrucomicrobiota bacterium]